MICLPSSAYETRIGGRSSQWYLSTRPSCDLRVPPPLWKKVSRSVGSAKPEESTIAVATAELAVIIDFNVH